MLTRRTLLQVLAASLLPSATRAVGESVSPRPNPALFQGGDFIWPKPPGAYVPYNAGSNNSPEDDARLWEAERSGYIKRQATTADPIISERVKLLRSMDYLEFLALYEGNQRLGVPSEYSGGSVYVGHVAILDMRRGVPYVIEALLKKGVVEATYEDWLASRPDQVIWLGRLRNWSQEDRARIAVEARRYIGRPYDFWNFDLDDDSKFYCSKLCWLSAFRALNLALDNNPNPKRPLWYSPKQLLNGPNTEKLHDPGPYASGGG